MMTAIVVLLIGSVISQAGFVVPLLVQVVPQGIESVNGSDVNMGCTSPLTNSGNVMVCGNTSDYATSYLSDGNSPAINTSTSDWASQLVTVRKNDGAAGFITFDHVVLTFGFDTAVSLTSIEVDLFLCPEWNIGAPLIAVYGDKSRDLVLRTFQSSPLGSRFNQRSQSSCDSLSIVSIPFRDDAVNSSYLTVHITVQMYQYSVEWVHVGEVRFLGRPAGPQTTLISTSSTSNPPTTSPPTLIITSTSIDIYSDSSFTMTIVPSTTPFETPTSSSFTYSISSTPSTTLVSPTPRISTPTTMVSRASVGPMSRPVTVTTPPPISTIPTDGDALPIPLYPLIGGIAAVVIIIIFLIVVMMLCVVSKHSHSKVQRKRAVMNGYDVARPPDDRTSDTVHIIPYTTNSGDLQYSNGNISATHSIALASLIDNPVYTRADENAGCLYEVIPGEHTVPPVVDGQPRHIPSATSTQSTTVDYNDEELMGVYEVIIPPETTAGVSAELPVYASVPEAQQIHAIQAELSIAEKEAEAAQNMDLYIDMMTPKVPLISSDLEQYMSRRSTLSGGIYTEDINPSDFTRDGSQELGVEGEGDVQVYAPIYPALKVLPEGFQQPFEVSSDNIKVMEALRIGQFGEVVLATTNGLSLKDMRLSKIEESRDISIHVAVKKLKPQLPQIEQEDFNQETKFMSCLKHPNVVRLLGVCYYDPAFIMMEYMEEGDLSQFLQRHSEIVPIITPSSNTQITSSTLVYMASQIASAMKYLADFNFIHRDLASRNCFVGRNTTVKVADLGVNMNLYKTHYYRIRDNTLVPIRWMATECFSGKFSEKSDVWAFGVTLWELFTLAKDRPHPALSDKEVTQNAFMGEYCQFPSKPEACPRPVYMIMERCWVVDMTQRATFQELHKQLQMCL